MLEKNKQAVTALLAEFIPRIIGQKMPKLSCACGGAHKPAEAIEVHPAGEYCPGQEENPYLWSVRMRELDSTKPAGQFDYSIGLSAFIPKEELAVIFASHFAL